MRLWQSYDSRRKGLARRATAGPVAQYLARPWPELALDARAASLLSLDLETSGLTPMHDDIVSIGWVLIDQARIDLSSVQKHLVRPRSLLPASSVVIHGISDERAAHGRRLAHVLEELLCAMTGRIIVGHHVSMDLAFLAVACRRLGWGNIAFPAVDTLSLLRRRARRRQVAVDPDTLRLERIRHSYGLPPYPEHDALFDAIAAAELWLALRAEMAGKSGRLPLRQVTEVCP